MNSLKNDKLVCAHYISTYLPLIGSWIYNILINYDKYKPIMLTRNIANFDQFSIDNIISLSRLNKFSYLYNFTVFKTSGYFPIFKKYCLKKNVKILHVHFGYHGIKLIGLKKQLNVPMVCSFYGNDVYKWPNQKKYRAGLQKLFKEADQILALGPYMQDHLCKLGCPDQKIVIQHLGVSVDQIKYKPRKYHGSEPIRFLMASSFVKKKGIDIVLNALYFIGKDTDFQVDIIGDGYLKNDLMQLVRELKLEERVTFHGYQPYSYFIDLSYHCHIFLQASKTAENGDKEGTPMSLVDAMATGMPVISTYHSDIPEIVINSKNGFLAVENNIKDFTNAVLKILNNISNLEKFSQNARKHIEEYFNSKIQAIKLEEIYNKLISNNISS